jgi:hypothetical protein
MVDVALIERGGEELLREAGAARVDKVAPVDEALLAMNMQRSDEACRCGVLIADGEEGLAGHGGGMGQHQRPCEALAAPNCVLSQLPENCPLRVRRLSGRNAENQAFIAYCMHSGLMP